MGDVERRLRITARKRIENGGAFDVVFHFERGDEGRDVVRPNIGGNVNIIGRARQTISRTSDRAADVVGDAELLENAGDRENGRWNRHASLDRWRLTHTPRVFRPK